MTGKRYIPIFALSLSVVSACVALRESPRKVQAFPLNQAYTEVQADPGVVDLACYGDGKGLLDDGTRKSWDDSYCGCVDGKTVWISRHPTCDIDRVRKHENCHIKLGSSKAARAKCLKDLPPRSR